MLLTQTVRKRPLKITSSEINVSATSICGQKIFLVFRFNCDVSALLSHACPVYSHLSNCFTPMTQKVFQLHSDQPLI